MRLTGLFMACLAMVGAGLGDSFEIYEFPDGRTVAPIESEFVSMLAETVLIEPTGDLEAWVPLMRVTCRFVFENRSDRPVSISMGFPFDTEFGDAYTTFGESELIRELPEWPDGEDASDRIPEVMDFTAEVAGEPVPVSFRKIERRVGEELLWFPVVATWEVDFGPGEVLEVVNSYTTGWDYDGATGGSTYRLDYILTSGASWLGPIGRGLITVAMPPDLSREQYSDSIVCYWSASRGVEWSGDTLRWAFEDLEPECDINVTVHERHWSYELDYLGYGDARSRLEAMDWNEDRLYAEILESFSELIYMPIPPERLLMCCCNMIYEDLGEDQPYASSGWVLGAGGADAPDPSRLPEPYSGRVAMLQTWIERFEEMRSELDRAGFLGFLPVFTDRWRWTADDLLRYERQPERERAYLALLLELENAFDGEPIEDESIRQFYMLTGWYTGHGPNALSEGRTPIPGELVERRLAEL